MKKYILLLVSMLLVMACKKDSVDASSTIAMQSSINDMTSSLPTIQQIKFNEALYILKTFGVEAEGDQNELHALGKLINGKKVPEILALADQTAQQHGIEWTSTGPPSLGEMNIFGETEAKESDPNDITANSLSILTKVSAGDSILGPKALLITPRLVDATGNPIEFSGAGLETTMEVFSNGVRLLSSKNMMTDNNFHGFNLRFASLPSQKVTDNKIDITVSVKTTDKTYKMSKIGVDVNPKALLMPAGDPAQNPSNVVVPPDDSTPFPPIEDPAVPSTSTPAASGDPKTSVTRFLNNLGSQNLRGAYNSSQNPQWGSYETFSNPTSGFGGVKSINVKNIATGTTGANSSTVNATYDVTDKEGRTTALNVTFGLKNVNGEWKISSYKVN